MRRPGVWLTLVGMLASGIGVSTGMAQRPQRGSTSPATLPNTRQHLLHSRVNGRTYLIQVALPSALVNAKPGDPSRYPALYLLDGTLDFPLLFSNMQFASMVQPTRTFLVGVTAADSEEKWRSFDYTPPLAAVDSAYFRGKSFGMPLVGGAPQFLRVLKEEVIPLIDSTYSTSSDRGIEGTSFGGLFVAYAMLQEPDLFARYAMVSPSLWYPWGRETGSILAREPGFAKLHATFPKVVYVSVGSEEIPGQLAMSAIRFVDQLCSSMSSGYYKGLDLGFEVLPGQPHGSPAARTRVLAALYFADSTMLKPGRGVMRSCR